MYFCFIFPFCIACSILMVLLTVAAMPYLRQQWGGRVVLLIPLSAIAGVFVGWQALKLIV